MGYIVEVKYFNTFLLKRVMNSSATRGHWPNIITATQNNSYPAELQFDLNAGSGADADDNWVIEESRIRGGYNNTSVDFGVKAYLVEEEPNASLRENSLIYSGIFNSRTGINQTNVFNVGEDITKSADPANGSIQKLYAEDTNLIIFQENKVSRALIDKDAIYNAEGGGNVTSVNTTIGTIQPYAGNYGISQNPESFAVYGYRKYFSDKDRNAILRLSMDGITEISNYGMYDYFRDELGKMNDQAEAIGGWDIHNKMYTLSLQYTQPSGSTFRTLAFDEQVNGWPSFFSYKPDNLFWLNNGFYSTTGQDIYKHYSNNVNPGNFYGNDNASSITFIFNPNVSLSKVFKTINYEGDSGWFISDINTSEGDSGRFIYSYVEGAYDSADPAATGEAAFLSTAQQPINFAGFMKQEGKYKANIVNQSAPVYGEVIFGSQMMGVKGYYTTVTIKTDGITNPQTVKELFAVSSEYVESYY